MFIKYFLQRFSDEVPAQRFADKNIGTFFDGSCLFTRTIVSANHNYFEGGEIFFDTAYAVKSGSIGQMNVQEQQSGHVLIQLIESFLQCIGYDRDKTFLLQHVAKQETNVWFIIND